MPIEASRHELAAMLDSMQEAVVAVNQKGRSLVECGHAAHRRALSRRPSAGRFGARSGRAFVRDGALSQRESFNGSAQLAPGRIFEMSAAPTPAGGAVAVLHDVTRIEPRRSPGATLSPMSSMNCEHRLHPFRDMWKRSLKATRRFRTRRGSFWPYPEERHAHEPPDGRPAGAGECRTG